MSDTFQQITVHAPTSKEKLYLYRQSKEAPKVIRNTAVPTCLPRGYEAMARILANRNA